MEKINFIQISLFLFGAIAIVIGGALLVVPVSFEASAGIDLDNNISLLSEIRAYGGMTFFSGIIILLGAFFSKLLRLSLGLSALLYLSLGLSRLVGLLVDGIPSQILITALILEILFGLLSVFMFLKTGEQKSAK